MPERNPNQESCPFIEVMEVVGGKWRGTIIFCLAQRSLRFNELRREIGTITQKMLTQELRSLERDGLVNRKQFPEIPPKVVYSLTELAHTLTPVFEQINAWSPHLAQVMKARTAYEERHEGVGVGFHEGP